jgi:outer membrane protein OmpA-like peptidoglycan-associated protein
VFGERIALFGHIAEKIHFIIFPSGRDALTETADKQLDVAARLYRDANPVLMRVAGDADAQGGEYHNVLLFAYRAEAVKQGLVARGLPSHRLLLQAFGHAAASAGRRRSEARSTSC